MGGYTLKEAAKYLGIKQRVLRRYVYRRKINAEKIEHNLYFFEESELQRYKQNHPKITPKIALSEEKFDAKYGKGKHQRLIKLLSQSCVSYVEIADKFNVSREQVSNWHDELFPNETGRDRQKACTSFNKKRELSKDELFRKFYSSIRCYFLPQDLEFILMKDESPQFRKRVVKLKGKRIKLAKAYRNKLLEAYGNYNDKLYSLHCPSDYCDFIFYFLDNKDFLFMPPSTLPNGRTTFEDSESSKYYKFKNNFDALLKN